MHKYRRLQRQIKNLRGEIVKLSKTQTEEGLLEEEVIYLRQLRQMLTTRCVALLELKRTIDEEEQRYNNDSGRKPRKR